MYREAVTQDALEGRATFFGNSPAWKILLGNHNLNPVQMEDIEAEGCQP
jgi:hypothetical protein